MSGLSEIGAAPPSADPLSCEARARKEAPLTGRRRSAPSNIRSVQSPRGSILGGDLPMHFALKTDFGSQQSNQLPNAARHHWLARKRSNAAL